MFRLDQGSYTYLFILYILKTKKSIDQLRALLKISALNFDLEFNILLTVVIIIWELIISIFLIIYCSKTFFFNVPLARLMVISNSLVDIIQICLSRATFPDPLSKSETDPASINKAGK